MSNPFDSDAMDEFSADAAADLAEGAADGDGFDEDSFEADGFDADGFDEEGFDEADAPAAPAASSFDDGFDAFDDGAEDGDAFEMALADAMDAEDSDEFFGRLLSGIGQVAGMVGRGARRARAAEVVAAPRARRVPPPMSPTGSAGSPAASAALPSKSVGLRARSAASPMPASAAVPAPCCRC